MAIMMPALLLRLVSLKNALGAPQLGHAASLAEYRAPHAQSIHDSGTVSLLPEGAACV
jgi:hypothetical protein